jgi:predicted nucleic acid-binding protein
MPVVSNTSPVLSLAIIGQLDLLHQQFSHDGRVTTTAMGLVPVGVLGVLLRAKRMGNLDSVVTAMRALQDQAGFFINPDLFASLARGRRTLIPDFVIRPHCSDRRVIFW